MSNLAEFFLHLGLCSQRAISFSMPWWVGTQVYFITYRDAQVHCLFLLCSPLHNQTLLCALLDENSLKRWIPSSQNCRKKPVESALKTFLDSERGLKLHSYSTHLVFFTTLSHVHFVLEGLADILLTKCFPKSDAALRVEKSSTSKMFHAHDTWHYVHLYLPQEQRCSKSWKKVQLQERFTLMTHDIMFICKRSAWMFCSWAAVLSMSRNTCSSPLSVFKKTASFLI